MVFFRNHLRAIKVGQDQVDTTTILRVCDSSSIVGFCDHVNQSFIWYIIVVIDELEKLIFGDSQVRYRELIRNVPAEWTELSAFEDKCVEEAKTPQQTSENDRFFAVVKLIFAERQI